MRHQLRIIGWSRAAYHLVQKFQLGWFLHLLYRRHPLAPIARVLPYCYLFFCFVSSEAKRIYLSYLFIEVEWPIKTELVI